MQDLTVIGVENGALLVACDDGERYRIAIDDVLQIRLRQADPTPAATGRSSRRAKSRRTSASGMSAEDVADSRAPTRLRRALRGPGSRRTRARRRLRAQGGRAGRLRLDPLGEEPRRPSARSSRSASRRSASPTNGGPAGRTESGWIVKLAFTADEIDHDARWQLRRPKSHALAPLNTEASPSRSTARSRRGSSHACARSRRTQPSADDARFDSGAFTNDDAQRPAYPSGAVLDPSVRSLTAARRHSIAPAIKRADDEPAEEPATRRPTCSRRSAAAGASARPQSSTRQREAHPRRGAVIDASSTSRSHERATADCSPRRAIGGPNRRPLDGLDAGVGTRPRQPRSRSPHDGVARRCRAGTRSCSARAPTTTSPDGGLERDVGAR